MNDPTKPVGSKKVKEYDQLRKEFCCAFRIGRFGVEFLPKELNGKIYKLFQIIPLDGWITVPKEVERMMRERGLEL